MRVLPLVLLLAGCASHPLVPAAPEVVHVRVTTYVPIPSKMTEPCPIARGGLEDVIIVARERKASLEGCNAKLEAIRAVQGTDTEPTKVEP